MTMSHDGCAAIAGCLISLAGVVPAAGQDTAAGAVQVHFATSCRTDVQSTFDRAVTLLHSFEYPEATRLFAEIAERDPACAMARWGAAMCVWHPLWAPPSAAELERGAAILAGASSLEATSRETAYLDALRAFFSSADTGTHRERAAAYERRTHEVYTNHLDDPEAAVFYALALLATADPRDKSYPHQFEAAGLLGWVRGIQPTHPGALHYLIHSYDYPGLAHLALEVARTYAHAAPDSAHAQHMPSHIFTRLGLWEEAIASNHDSTRSAAEYTERAHLAGHYDEGLHSMDYLMYALLQTARDDEARELLSKLRGIGKTDTDNFKVAYTYASSPARYALERRQWVEASALLLEPAEFPWQEFGWARATHHFARGIGFARSGRPEPAREELAMLERLQRELPQETLLYWREEVQVQIDAVASWTLLAEGKPEEALRAAAAAADREDAVDKHPVTPGEVLPARELYADLLLETGRHAEALAQYRIVLHRSPNRLNALLGAARAATEVRDPALAERYRAVAREQTRSGEREGLGLA